ncbi:hypothetical protein BDW72DRAFT_204249 [Aspergillus terricola var. indicus]
MSITGYAFIVGGGIGIGRACALALANDGAAGLLIADIDTAAAKKTATQCQEVATNQQFRVETTHVDITDETSVKTAATMATTVFGRIDYSVNCAGIGPNSHTEIADSDLSAYQRMLDVNVTGTFLVIREISAIMRSQEPRRLLSPLGDHRGSTRGAIVVLGSAASHVATPRVAPYTAAKHAVIGMVKTAAIDNIPHGIRVNAVCPSFVNTPGVQAALGADQELEEVITKMHPMGRIANAEEVADAVCFLCSDRSSYITGCGLFVDGGSTLNCHV